MLRRPPPLRRLFSSGPAARVSANVLSRVRATFPNTRSRLDLVADAEAPIRVAVIPFGTPRASVKLVLDNILADPLSSAQGWHEAIAHRNLQRTAWVKYSDTFDIEISDTEVVEYDVPFSVPRHQAVTAGREVEIVEADSVEDVGERCHRILYVATDPETAYGKELDCEDPHDLFLDLREPAKSGSQDVTVISSALAHEANELFKQSPANASEYLALLERSNMSAVHAAVFGRTLGQSRIQVLYSVLRSCETATRDGETALVRLEPETRAIADLRSQWARAAHRELQTTYTNRVTELVSHELAWYKLYFRVDDVHAVVSSALAQGLFLDKSKMQLEYLVGRIDEASAGLPYSLSGAGDTDSSAEVSALFASAQRALVDGLAVTLHNYALRTLVIASGIQLSSVLLAALLYLGPAASYLPAAWGPSTQELVVHAAEALVAGSGVGGGLVYLWRRWRRATAAFVSDAVQRGKVTIEECERGLYRLWEHKIEVGALQSRARQAVTEQLRQELHRDEEGIW